MPKVFSNQPYNPMLNDIGMHFLARLQDVMADTVDTCERAEIDRRETIRMVAGVLMSELIRVCDALGYDEKSFMMMCLSAYRTLDHNIDDSP